MENRNLRKERIVSDITRGNPGFLETNGCYGVARLFVLVYVLFMPVSEKQVGA